MSNKEPNIATRFSKVYQPEKNGHPKGVQNRSTVAKRVLSMNCRLPEKILEQLKKDFPQLTDNMTIEEIMTIIQAREAITKADSTAYRALMDSAYGQPKQEVIIDKPNITAIQFNVKR